ncbi:MAG: zinc-finger domain-containing protein [Oligoflexales bacterium]|nr:zinc-finger domain-containing protein [Oligoflexales bacterium]
MSQYNDMISQSFCSIGQHRGKLSGTKYSYAFCIKSCQISDISIGFC